MQEKVIRRVALIPWGKIIEHSFESFGAIGMRRLRLL